MSELFVWEGEVDWVVAENEEEVKKILVETYGPLDVEEMGDDFCKCEPNEELRITMDDGATFVTKTMKEWIESQGKGFLCSTEW